MVKHLCRELASISSRVEKEHLLWKHRQDQDLIDVLQFVYNPFIVSGLSDKKIFKDVWHVPVTKEFQTLREVFEYLKTNNTGRDEDIANIQAFILQHEEHRDFLEEVFTKSLSIGCGVTTLNRVWGPSFLPTFACMLAHKYEGDLHGSEFTLTQKLDGIRCLAIKERANVHVFSRSGREIEGLYDITEHLRKLTGDFVFDGELLVQGFDKMASKSAYKATTQLARTKAPRKQGLTFQIFDMLPYEEFIERKGSTSYRDRRIALTETIQPSDVMSVLPALYIGTDVGVISRHLKDILERKQEGLMLNLNNAPYEFKRTKNLLKIKEMHDIDLPVVGYQEGTGKLSSTLGRLTVLYKGTEVGVGSGFTEEERHRLWAQKDRLIGQTCTVQYFEETVGANGFSLRFPVFLRIRSEV